MGGGGPMSPAIDPLGLGIGFARVYGPAGGLPTPTFVGTWSPLEPTHPPFTAVPMSGQACPMGDHLRENRHLHVVPHGTRK